MAPPVEAFPASKLPARMQFDALGQRRKQPIDLSACKLQELVQYSCDVTNQKDPRARVVCRPVVRLFRRCKDGIMVETTALESP